MLIGSALALAFFTFSTFSSVQKVEHFVLALAGGVAAPEALRFYHGRRNPKQKTQRGSSVATAADVAARVKKTKQPFDLVLGGVPVPKEVEPFHLLFVGATGTGKSVCMSALIEAIRAAGDTAIIVDSGGEFTSKFFDAERDAIFNPHDARCVAWSPTAEMAGPWDAQSIARSIVPDGEGDAKEWNSYAQTYVTAILRKLWEQNKLTLRDFLYYVQAASIGELRALLAGTSAAAQLESEKTLGSIRTIAGNYVTSYDYLPVGSQSYSVADFIRREPDGFLYLSYRDDQLDSVRNMMACILDVAARTILSLNPDPNRRVWLVIDEVASLGKIQSIEQVATKARKNGGCLALGLQSVSQLRDRYGEHGAQTILSCLSTWMVLRCSDAETADYMSKYVGESEVLRTQMGSSKSDSGDTESANEQVQVQRTVLPSQIQAFKDRHGLLRLKGDYPVCEVDLKLPAAREPRAAAFEARDFNAKPLLSLIEQRIEIPAPVAPVAPKATEPKVTQQQAPVQVAATAAPTIQAAQLSEDEEALRISNMLRAEREAVAARLAAKAEAEAQQRAAEVAEVAATEVANEDEEGDDDQYEVETGQSYVSRTAARFANMKKKLERRLVALDPKKPMVQPAMAKRERRAVSPEESSFTFSDWR